MVLGHNAEDRQLLQELYANGRKNGVLRLFIIEREQIRALEPNIHPSVECALYCPDAGITSPYEYTIALAENAVVNGVQMQLNTEVTGIQKRADGAFQVQTKRTDDGKHTVYTCTYAINCAGLYADKVAHMVGAANFKLMPRKGTPPHAL
jgi:glycerol-3-phosphate dehydrogenase